MAGTWKRLAFADETIVYLSRYGLLSTAIPAIGSTITTLILDTSPTLSGDFTVPGNITLRAVPGQHLHITSGTLTILGPFECPPNVQAFALSGSGAVHFYDIPNNIYRDPPTSQDCIVSSITEVHPGWFCNNAEPGVTDMTAAINAAFVAAPEGGTVKLSAETYFLGYTSPTYDSQLISVTRAVNIVGESRMGSILLVDQDTPTTTDILHINIPGETRGQHIHHFTIRGEDYAEEYPQVSGAPGQHAIHVTSTALNQSWGYNRIYELNIAPTSGRSIYLDFGHRDGSTMFSIYNNQLACGIYGFGVADGVQLRNNAIQGPGYGIDITQNHGSMHLLIAENDIIAGGCVRLRRGLGPIIQNNGLECHYAFTDRSLVSYSGSHYRCVQSHISSASILPTDTDYWEANTESLVSYSGSHYRCIAAHKSNEAYNIKPTNTMYWEVNTGSTTGETVWADDTAYSTTDGETAWAQDTEYFYGNRALVWLDGYGGDIVTGTDGYDYRCIVGHTSDDDVSTGNKPTTSANYATYWTKLATTTQGSAWIDGVSYQPEEDVKDAMILNNGFVALDSDWIGAGGSGANMAIFVDRAQSTWIEGNLFELGYGAIGAGGFIYAAKISPNSNIAMFGTGNTAEMLDILNTYQQLLGWTVYSGTKFQLDCPWEPERLFWGSTEVTKGASVAGLNDNEWYWSSGTLYMRQDKSGSIVLGTDEGGGTYYDYQCISDHTSDSSTRPVTGGSYSGKWEKMDPQPSPVISWAWTDATAYYDSVGGGYVHPYATYADFSTHPYIDDAGTDTRIGVDTRVPVKIVRHAADGSMADYMVLATSGYENSYQHKIKSSHSQQAASNKLTVELASGESTTTEVLRLRGDGVVGINEDSPTHNLHVTNPSDGSLPLTIGAYTPETQSGYKAGGIWIGRTYGTDYDASAMFHIPDFDTPTGDSKMAWYMYGNSYELMSLKGTGAWRVRGAGQIGGGGADATIADTITLNTTNYPSSYLHKIRTSHSGTLGYNLLAINLATGLTTDREVFRLRGDGRMWAEAGWALDPDTWTYASSTSFTVAGDVTSRFTPGTKLCMTQTSAKYFYVASSSYSSPNTTVTVTGGADYTVANAAITDNMYSYIANPPGFPQWFSLASSYWYGFSSPPSTLIRFRIDGRTVHMLAAGVGTSNQTYCGFYTPIAAKTLTGYVSLCFGLMCIAATSWDLGYVSINSGEQIAKAYFFASGGHPGSGPTTWTNSGTKGIYCNFFYEI